MLLISKFRCNWLKLPSLSVLNSNRAVFLYLFSNQQPLNTEFSNIFSENKKLASYVKNSEIDCYSSDISHIPHAIIDKLEVTTIPVVLGILNGNKLGEILKNANQDSFLTLCDKLKSYSSPVDSEHISNMRELIKNGNLTELKANLSYVKNNLVRETEADPTLFKLVSEASIICQDDNKTNLNDLLADLENLNKILARLETSSLSGKFTKQSLKESLSDLNSLANKYLSSNNLSHNENNTDFKPKLQNVNELRNCYLIKKLLLKLISVKYFLDKNMNEALKYSTEAYKVNVKAFNKDLITDEEFGQCGSREVLGSLYSLFDSKDPLLLNSRSEIENILGKRLLPELTESTKPKGGVTKKRRGFGGRYIWQGMEYRPKKYKPKNIKRYLNEWRCVSDSNVPSFN